MALFPAILAFDHAANYRRALIKASSALCPATLAERQGYAVCYDTANQRALWTVHQPSPSNARTPRKYWRTDLALNSLPSSAFTNTGFDCSHLASSVDLPDSPDTFLSSSAIPQDRKLNCGLWRKLENRIRREHATLVVTSIIYKITLLPDGHILTEYAPNTRSLANNPPNINTLREPQPKSALRQNAFTGFG